LANTIKLPQLAWHGVKELELSFPEGWQVEVCNMAGHDRPRLKPGLRGHDQPRHEGLH